MAKVQKIQTMKKTITILMALMVLFFTQCKPTPEGGDENSRKVKVSCTIPINNGDRSDFTNLMETGKVNWSEGYERVYLAVHGETPKIIELVSWAEGTPSNLEFTGEAAEGLITSGEEYDIWYFGHSQQLETPYFSNDGESLTGSIANQSGRLEDLGYSHIAKTTVTAVNENDEVKLNLKGTLKNQIAIALLDLESVEELYGNAITGTEYALEYTGERYELNVTKNKNAKIEVESASGISYVALLPNDKNESMIKHKKGDKTYAYTFHSEIKANKIYYRSGLDGTTPEALKWVEIEENEEMEGHECVDLGLTSGLKWAAYNLGAEAPEEYGDFYAWGETTTKAEFNDDNCVTIDKIMNDISGNAQFDAATANWGGEWRMPRYEEFEELVEECTWTWTSQSGVNGYKVTGPNGNSIFLPAAGVNYYELQGEGELCAYWNSKPSSDISAYCVYFAREDCEDLNVTSPRSCGHAIRPVSGGSFTGPEEQPEEPETPENPDYDNHEYVDLGLSVKWATCNVGANSPEEYGDYFAWGETKSESTQANSLTYGKSLNDITGNPQYDAATANWGGDWRMPTYDELNELRTQCTWTWTTQNSVNGYKVTSKTNGNSIFLPAAGYRYGSSLNDAGSGGYYWSSTPHGYYDYFAYRLYFYSSSHGMGNCRHDYVQSVRPVLE